jgi:hypothetical protein
VLRDTGKVHVVAREVRVHGVVDVRDVVLDVDLLVDRALALGVEVRRPREGIAAVIGDGVRGFGLDDGLI